VGVGHLAVGLALKGVEPRINAGFLLFAALAADFLLGVFALAGWESYQVPAGFAQLHYLTFTFPWSHGLAATAIWASLAGLLGWGHGRAGVAAALAVLSHFVLDGLVHVAGLPLLGPDSPKVGLALWKHLPLELALEAAMLAAAATWYVRRTGRWGMAVFLGIVAAVMIPGQLLGTAAPERTALLFSWLAMPPLIAAIAWRLDRA
jgi:hypothetical protein